MHGLSQTKRFVVVDVNVFQGIHDEHSGPVANTFVARCGKVCFGEQVDGGILLEKRRQIETFAQLVKSSKFNVSLQFITISHQYTFLKSSIKHHLIVCFYLTFHLFYVILSL